MFLSLFFPFLLQAENLNEVLYKAASEGELLSVKKALQIGADIDARDVQTGWSPLMAASFYAHPEIVEFLLKKGAQVDFKDKSGQTALMAAITSEKSDLQVMKCLFKYKTDPNLSRKKDGFTPLMLAAQADRLEAVKLLLDNGANKKLKNVQGRTAFDLAEKSAIQELRALLRLD